MPHGIKQVLLRSTMGIMAGNAGVRPWPDPLMGVAERRVVQVVTIGTDLAGRFPGQGRVIGSVGIMTSGTVLSGRRMQRAIPPVFSNFTVAIETQGRLTFALEARVR